MRVLVRTAGLLCVFFLLLATQAVASSEYDAFLKAKRDYLSQKKAYLKYVADGKKKYSKEFKELSEYSTTRSWLLKNKSKKATTEYKRKYKEYKKLKSDLVSSKSFLRHYKERSQKKKQVLALRSDTLKKYAAYKKAKGKTSGSSSSASSKFSPRLSISPQKGKAGDKFTFVVRGKSSADSNLKGVYLKFADYDKLISLNRSGAGKYTLSRTLSGAGLRSVQALVKYKNGAKNEYSSAVKLSIAENVVDLSRISSAKNPKTTKACFTVPVMTTFSEWVKQGRPVKVTESFLGVSSKIGPVKKQSTYYASIWDGSNAYESGKYQCVGLIKDFLHKYYGINGSRGNGDVVAKGLHNVTGKYNSKPIKMVYHANRYASAPPVIGSIISEWTGSRRNIGHVSMVKKIIVERKDSSGSPTKIKAYMFEQNYMSGSSAGSGKAKICPSRDRYSTFELKSNGKWYATGSKSNVIGWATAVYQK
ncbi:hypothetical protein [Maridesulfovibrio sp.]|uniref:hypothetical protein n=1 Tax=Maridesulfovibrio sp. TaxID=2795000 RepID=UPI0029C9E0DF|nr:hypothetical protein [Maridesulfovibrio sp.]